MTLHTYVASLFDTVRFERSDMRPYQNEGAQFLLDHPYSALFIDVGMGKTVISLTTILNLITRFDVTYPWLVIAPKRVANETWPTEIREWRHTCPLTFRHIRDEDLVDRINEAGQDERKKIKREGGDPKSKLSQMRIETARLECSKLVVRQFMRNNRAVVYIINREQVEWLVEAFGRDWPFKGVIIDESSCFKDHNTNRFKALRRVRPLIKRLHELTATPAAETYLHLFAQIYLLDEGERFGKFITKFRARYFTQNQWTRKWTLRPGAEEEIVAKIADICLTMKAEDYLDLEKPEYLIDKVYLDPQQRALYDQMATDMLITLPTGEEIEAETAAALSQKLLQMASGVVYENTLQEQPDGTFKKRRVVHHLHDHKIDAIESLIEDIGESVIVAYWHDASLHRLKERFKQAVEMDKDGKCVKLWNAGKIPILLMHPQSSAHGLNLQRGGRHIVFFDIPWSLELYEQFIGRLAGARQLARPEDQRVVFLHHLVCQGTIDEDVVEALKGKQDVQLLFFRLLKKMRRKLMQRGKCDL